MARYARKKKRVAKRKPAKRKPPSKNALRRRRLQQKVAAKWRAEVRKHGSVEAALRAQEEMFAKWTADYNREATENRRRWDPNFSWGFGHDGTVPHGRTTSSHGRYSSDAVGRARKLRNLARSPNPHEAALAKQRADEWMARHGISEADL